MEIGIVGLGIVGDSFSKMLEKQGYLIKKLDIYKNYFEDISKSDIVFICINETKNEMTLLKEVVEEVIKKNHKGIIVIRTTTALGTTDEFIKQYPDRTIAYIPEFLTERNAEYDTFHPDKVVIGTDDNEIFKILKELFKDIIYDERIIQVKPLEAEMVKLALNSLYTIKVVFAEEINSLAEHFGADYNNIYKAFCLDRYTNGEHLIAGKDGYRGASGKCLPKDSGFLAFAGRRNNNIMRLLETAIMMNTIYLRMKENGYERGNNTSKTEG